MATFLPRLAATDLAQEVANIASLKHFPQDVFGPLAIAAIAAILIFEADALTARSDIKDTKMNHPMVALFGPLGWPEIVIILVVALLLFGGKKLPELAKGLGKGLRVFKKEIKGVREGIEDAIEAEPEDEDNTQAADDTQDQEVQEDDTPVEKMH